jgi:hypothetical protein
VAIAFIFFLYLSVTLTLMTEITQWEGSNVLERDHVTTHPDHHYSLFSLDKSSASIAMKIMTAINADPRQRNGFRL